MDPPTPNAICRVLNYPTRPDGSFVSTGACNQVRIPIGTDICHRGCAYTVLQTVQMHGVYNAVYGTVHYKEPLESVEIRVGHNPSVAGFSLSQYCHDCAESDVKQYSYFLIFPTPKHWVRVV